MCLLIMCGMDRCGLATQISPPEKKQINLLFLDIHGQYSKLLGDKFSDDEFLKICNSYDILGLAETHTESTPTTLCPDSNF